MSEDRAEYTAGPPRTAAEPSARAVECAKAIAVWVRPDARAYPDEIEGLATIIQEALVAERAEVLAKHFLNEQGHSGVCTEAAPCRSCRYAISREDALAAPTPEASP